MPVQARDSPALMAGFLCDYDKAAELIPGNEIYPLKYFNGKAIFMVTVIEYRVTSIGKYIEYSIAIACTRGSKPAPRMLPAIFRQHYHTGQLYLTCLLVLKYQSKAEKVSGGCLA